MFLANYENSSSTYFTSPIIFASAIALRTILLFYGLFQDAYSPVKYTDIDYFVFTDAARYVSLGLSPYQRETYRYTPLLAWLLLPTTWPGPVWFSFGKVLFALADILAGYLIVHVLQSRAGGGMTPERALRFASIWLLNPMVATISTRGSSEGLLCTMVVALLWAVIHGRIKLAGVLLGLGVHFKIYPFIYGTSIIWCLDESWTSNKFKSDSRPKQEQRPTIRKMLHFMNPARLTLIISSLATFTALNLLMYTIYSGPFLTHTFVHHLTRVDHRHNFSPYNILLYQSSSSPKTGRFPFESLAFGPQLALSAFLIPICLSKKDLPGAMLAQTFAFVSFNKVCTSQYFLWYMILFPFYLRYSSFLSSPILGLKAAALWVFSQTLWLYQGYRLEFHGHSTFIPGLLLSSFFFFSVNVWVLGIIIADIKFRSSPTQGKGTWTIRPKTRNAVMRSPCVSSPKAASNGDARMNQKPTPVASGRPSVALNSPKWRTRPSMLPNTTSPVVGSSPPVGSDQKRVPFSPGARTNSNTTEITTPVKSFLNSNITPRSSSRKARKGSTSSTPNDSPNVTPRNSRPSSMIELQDKLPEDHSIRGMGQGIRKINTGGISKASSVVSDSQKSHCPLRSSSRERNNYGNATNPGSESQPKFFHADDIRPTLQTIASERFILEGKKSGAKSGRLKENHSSEISNQDSILTLQARRPKFCYADGTSDSPTVPLQLATRPTIRSPTIATQQVKRATSPLKDEILSRESSLSMPSSSPHTHNVSNATAACGQDIRRAEPLSVGHLNTSRRSSVSTLSQQRVRHAKSSSVSAVSSLSRRRPSTELSDVPCIDSPRSHPAADNRTPVQARAPSPSLSDSLYSKSATTFLLSPKLSPNKLEHANELAADARRERKVLDLEISNSSLLAINQTLEREMRKQLAELRRFRRQSQFGRTSDAQSLRSGSKKIGVLSEIDASSNRSRLAGHSLTPLSIEDEYDEDGDDKDSPSKLSFSSSNSLSDDCPIPTSHAALQDSKRLYLDYSRHRALLIDGQKLNQSIERCLGRSEDLIVAGKKALAYRVDVHELESLTGRVLLPDELEETGMWGPGQGLLSPGTGQREMSWEEQGGGNGLSKKGYERKNVRLLDVDDYRSLEEGEIYPESGLPSVRESYFADQESDPEFSNGWDSIKADVQTPDEIPDIGIQNIRRYLSTSEHNLENLL